MVNIFFNFLCVFSFFYFKYMYSCYIFGCSECGKWHSCALNFKTFLWEYTPRRFLPLTDFVLVAFSLLSILDPCISHGVGRNIPHTPRCIGFSSQSFRILDTWSWESLLYLCTGQDSCVVCWPHT